MSHLFDCLKKHFLLILSCACLFLGVAWETHIYKNKLTESEAAQFEQALNKQIEDASSVASELAGYAGQASLINAKIRISKQQDDLYTIHLYSGGKLVAWNRNELTTHRKLKNGVYFYGNKWFYLAYAEKDSVGCKVFVPIKTEYPYENAFLHNEFTALFTLPSGAGLNLRKTEGSYAVSDYRAGTVLCYVKSSYKTVISRADTQTIFFIYFSCWLLLLFWLSGQLDRLLFRSKKIWVEFTVFVAVLSFRSVLGYFKAPYICFQSELFSPSVYASSTYLPSLADLVIHVSVLLFCIERLRKIIANKWGVLKERLLVIFFLLGIFAGGLFYYINWIAGSLVNDSNIELQLNKIFEFSVYSFMAIFVVIALYHTLVLLIKGFAGLLISRETGLRAYVGFSVVAFTVFGVIDSLNDFTHVHAWWFFLLLLSIFPVFQSLKLKPSSLFALISISILCSAFINVSLFYEYKKKDHKLAQLYARNLANERDPLAEMLLKDIEEKMQADSLLKKMSRYTDYTSGTVENYIRRKYFSGFLKKYELQTTFCGQTENFAPSNFLENCFDYFMPILKESGIEVPESGFYYLDNQNGSISYLGTVSFMYDDSTVSDIYIELNSKLITEELGYPELLLAESFNQNQVLKKFSYAKYNNNDLISQNGTYNYPMRYARGSKLLSHRNSYKAHGWKHHTFQTSPDLIIVVSKEDSDWYDLLVALSYVFGILMLMHLPKQLFHQKLFVFFMHFNLQKKIQFSLFALLFTSLLLIAGAMLYLNYRQYENIEFDHAKEKLQSVVAAAFDKFALEEKLTKAQSNYLNYTLNIWSNTFFADINIYGVSGELLASSRPEIFEQKLTGDYMPAEAFLQMSILKQKEFVSYEHIGDMKFISAYAVLTSERGDVLGYVNLPYFTKQKEQSLRITGVVSAILNIYVLLIIFASIAAALTADRLTKPLQLLKQKIGNVSLDAKNEPIEWESNDELGEIISSYNTMLAQLENSVHKLAESERKNAWQKIARQIAHEIKNPLTPMKLNLQFLQRAWAKHDEKFEERLTKISESMIEQINSLAATANEFSNLAKISDVKKEKIELTGLAEKAAVTFEGIPNVKIVKELPVDKVYIVGDSEKLIRVFNNIIKNAIQAMPSGKDGTVSIKFRSEETSVVVSITDNGKGVDDDLKDRLFEPNFTTKSSGMGLGLAICKNIVDSHGGEIWFESEKNTGTVFYMKFIKV